MIDQRKLKLLRKIFVDAAVARSRVNQCLDEL